MSGTYAPARKTTTDEKDANFWSTRWETFHDAQRLYGRRFQFDVAAEPLTAKCDEFYCLARGEDALILPWPADYFCNPPFDLKVEFIKRARYHQQMGIGGMMLIPYEPCSNWWRENLSEDIIEYTPDGRIGFYERDGKTRKSGVNFPSVLICFPVHKIGPAIRVPYFRTPTPRPAKKLSLKPNRKRTRKVKK
ncbi:methylase [Pantoea phage Nafs113]|nr:methylase [Pantoea phage Nafs113]